MLSKINDIEIDRATVSEIGILRLWTSNLYSRINKILRNHSFEEQYKYTPRAFYFVQQMIQRFYTEGIYRKEILSMCKHLYKGNNGTIQPSTVETYKDNGFIATSMFKHVGCSFASSTTNCGTLYVFKVSELPKNVPFLLIDENLDFMYQEKEVLLLPGWIKRIPANTSAKTESTKLNATQKYLEYKCMYECDMTTVQNYMNKPPPKFKEYMGGASSMDIKDKLRRMRGNDVVFYRAIKGRDAEVLGVLHVPCDEKAFVRFVRLDLRLALDYYDNMTEFIPDVQDLQKRKKKTKQTIEKWMSYQVHFAIYDTTTNTVICIDGLSDSKLHYEMCPAERSGDVVNAINAYYNPSNSG